MYRYTNDSDSHFCKDFFRIPCYGWILYPIHCCLPGKSAMSGMFIRQSLISTVNDYFDQVYSAFFFASSIKMTLFRLLCTDTKTFYFIANKWWW